MRELNIEFQELYKRLDKLCREMYSSGEGVSAYIQDMENTPYSEWIAVNNWDGIYKQLKHARWMRNRLAHDISIDSDFCEQSDIAWIKNFYDSILSGNDPVARAYKAKQTAMQKHTTSNTINDDHSTSPKITEAEPRKSLWSRMVAIIKSWFS